MDKFESDIYDRGLFIWLFKHFSYYFFTLQTEQNWKRNLCDWLTKHLFIFHGLDGFSRKIMHKSLSTFMRNYTIHLFWGFCWLPLHWEKQLKLEGNSYRITLGEFQIFTVKYFERKAVSSILPLIWNMTGGRKESNWMQNHNFWLDMEWNVFF